MIEKTIRDYLLTKLSVPVYLERPEHPASSYVLIERTGGTMNEFVWHDTFAVQSYAASLLDTITLNNQVVGAMLDAITIPEITKVSLNATYNYTQTTMRQHRYQAVFEVVHL
jgi:hypothetical protein